MNSILFLIIIAVIGVLGIVSENMNRRSSTVLSKFLWFYFVFSVVFVSLIELNREDLGIQICLAFMWGVYLLFSIYLSIYTVIKSDKVIRTMMISLLWNFIMVFQFATEKELVSEYIIFDFVRYVKYTLILLLIQIPFIIGAKTIARHIKKNKKTE